jgi:HPt (histidine-containing phosphotransfer) domain-containing protein
MQPSIGSTEISIAELEALLEQGRQEPLREDGYQKLRNAVRTLGLVTELLEKQETTLAELRELFCAASTEKTAKVLERAGINSGEKKPKAERKKPAAGHGRNGAAAYGGARRIQVPHESLQSGDPCPAGCGGKVYPQHDPGLRVRIYGQAPIAAIVYELARLRCNLCGDVFTAAAPPEVGEKKYDETAASMMAVLRYGNGFPWTRLEGLQHGLGIPLPSATQCEILAETVVPLRPAFQELVRQAAQWELVHNDDTSMRVLSLDRGDVSPERTGVFTSGIVWVFQQRRIALFFTGAKHAGENLADVLRQRRLELPPPIQMCDALSRNMPKLPAPLQTVVANCLAHGRRGFVKVIASFPEQCRFVLETLGEVYKYDEQARVARLTPEDRLHFHQQYSKPVMDKLETWLKAQFAERLVEPNSGLGKAISYLLNHWARLTLFLEKAGTPLDNNLAERSLKKAILHRKNSLFYKTRNGAQMGDLYMSLVHTCELNGANPFDYLTELQRHAEQLKQAPGEWMPWNYREQLVPAVSGIDSG